MGGLSSQLIGIVVTGVLTFLGGVITGLLAIYAKRSSSPAELLTARTSAWRELMLQSETVISRLTARNEELDQRQDVLEDLRGDALRDNEALKEENLRLLGEIRQRDQRLLSLLTALERAGKEKKDED